MALTIKLLQHKASEFNGKWYGRVVKTGETHTKELAKAICDSTTLTRADVEASIIALVEEMKRCLQNGETVVLDGFGRFHLSIKSDMVEEAKDYNLKKHVRKIRCLFTPAGSRNQLDHHIERFFTDGVGLQRSI